ncbi:uncharacterized protein [Rutidosis leptorrhynchoides]|uniref:uncharacterized protein n=1 Tax=Rutidosis leptorrhynchoides TaxID=125765 RepID=UPI003A9A6029
MASSFGCIASKLPFTYLGMPIGHKMNRKEAWDLVINKVNKLLSDWKARTMSFGGRLTLVKMVLSSLPVYFFSLFRAPSNVINWLERRGGLNIGSLKSKNLALLVKDRVVFSSGCWIFNWSWLRRITGRLHREIDQIVSMVKSCTSFGNCENSWLCKLDNSGLYKTRTMANKIDELSLPRNNSSIVTPRNNFLPQKIGIFIWITLRGRIPVRVELDKRGIDLDTLLCPMCNDALKEVNHGLISCKYAKEVWEGSYKWWGANVPVNANLSEFFNGAGHEGLSDYPKKIWQAIAWVAGYYIWMNRNLKVFRNDEWASPKVINEIQVKTYEWLNNRSKQKVAEWLQFLLHPNYMGLPHVNNLDPG